VSLQATRCRPTFWFRQVSAMQRLAWQTGENLRPRSERPCGPHARRLRRPAAPCRFAHGCARRHRGCAWTRPV